MQESNDHTSEAASITIKSGDLTTKCPASRLYYRAGKFDAIIPRAMARGLMAGRAIEQILDDPPEDLSQIPSLITVAKDLMLCGMADEGRTAGSWEPDDIALEITPAMGYFCERVIPWLKENGWKLVGQEVPIRWEVGEGVEFSSHLDALFECEGDFLILDWKWTKEAPTHRHCDMDLQMRSYRAALMFGEVCIDGFWTPMPMERPPAAALVWLPGLMPYSRRVKCTIKGEERVFLKGDARPFDKVIHWCSSPSLDVPAITNQILLRAKWLASGIAPEIPTPDGCMVCSSKQWCCTTQQIED